MQQTEMHAAYLRPKTADSLVIARNPIGVARSSHSVLPRKNSCHMNLAESRQDPPSFNTRAWLPDTGTLMKEYRSSCRTCDSGLMRSAGREDGLGNILLLGRTADTVGKSSLLGLRHRAHPIYGGGEGAHLKRLDDDRVEARLVAGLHIITGAKPRHGDPSRPTSGTQLGDQLPPVAVGKPDVRDDKIECSFCTLGDGLRVGQRHLHRVPCTLKQAADSSSGILVIVDNQDLQKGRARR